MTIKERIILIVFMLIISAVGAFLIADTKITIGVILLMWANNISLKL